MESVRTIQNTEYSRNVPETERWISAIAGGALLTYGLKAQGTALRVVTGVAAAGLFHRAITGHCMLYSALDINRAEDRSGVVSVRHGHGNKIEKSVTIDKPAHELYQWWRNLENLQQILPNIKSVQVDGNRSHWTIEGPGHMTFEWNAEIYVEQEDELIAWRSLESSEPHAGLPNSPEIARRSARLPVLHKSLHSTQRSCDRDPRLSNETGSHRPAPI